ncbi:hypothetical protein L0152_01540 [bacterium]|nr:hypothetical protein [bacterium]
MNALRKLISEALSVPAQLWKERQSSQTPMYVAGFILVCSGLFHVLVFLASGGSWEGPISWRKPILFGITGGLTTISVAWVMGYLSQRKSLHIMGWIFAVSMFVEVSLITMQKWRGVASHFNVAAAFDRTLFSLMGTLIMIVAIIIVIVTVRSFKVLNARPEMKLAIRAGLFFLNLTNVLGIVLIAYGNYIMRVSPGHAPNIFGQAGMMKVPHGLAIHAIQVLPVLAWLLNFSQREIEFKLRTMKTAIAGYAGLQFFTLFQTFTGRAPQDVNAYTAALAIVSAIVLAAAFVKALTKIEDGGLSMQPQEVR